MRSAYCCFKRCKEVRSLALVGTVAPIFLAVPEGAAAAKASYESSSSSSFFDSFFLFSSTFVCYVHNNIYVIIR